MAVYTQIPAEEMAELVLQFGAGNLISAKGIVADHHVPVIAQRNGRCQGQSSRPPVHT